MPQYLSPGVYIEELVGPHPIQGVSTSTTGMVGVTVRGPTDGKPKLVTNFNDYQRIFGGFLPPPGQLALSTWGDQNNPDGGAWWLFPMAVKGFFDNGGQQLYVKRVYAADKSATVTGAKPASATLTGGLFADVVKTAAKGATVITVSHLVGISAQTQITLLYQDPAAPKTQSNTVQDYTYGATGNTITLTHALDQQLHAGQDLVQIKAPDNVATLTVTAASQGTWGQGIGVQVVPAVTTLGLLADPAEGGPFATVVAAKADKNSPTVNVTAVPGLDTATPALPFWVQIGTDLFEVNSAPVQADATTLTLTLLSADGTPAPAHDPWRAGLAVRRVRRANAQDSPTLRVAGAGRLYQNAVVELDDGTHKQTLQVTAVQGNVVTFTPNATAGYFETAQLHLVEMQITDSYDDGTGPVAETFANLRLGNQDVLGAASRIDGLSQLITVSQAETLVNVDDFRLPVGPAGSAFKLEGGDDAYPNLGVEDFVGTDGGSGHRTGIQAMEDIDEIAICAVPGMWSQTVQAALIDHCTLLKDRFAILDPPDGLDIDGIGTFRQVFDTQYAALYYPWCVTADLTPGAVSGSSIAVPPSGLMAGIYAATDISRGVHKAPANVVIQGINLTGGLAADVTKREQDVLNPVGINALRFFPGLGERVWGARTLSSDTDWKYVNVRRLFIYVEKSIYNGTQWVVFEPNNDQLWALVRQSITAFLTTVWQTGALAGTTPDQAFLVQCDRTTMSQDDLDNGRLICIVGLAPVYPAEFVIFRFEQKTASSPQS
jgi:uncharacterized protein